MQISNLLQKLQKRFGDQVIQKKKVEDIIREVAGLPEDIYLVCTLTEGILKIEGSPSVRQKIFSQEEEIKVKMKERMNVVVYKIS